MKNLMRLLAVFFVAGSAQAGLLSELLPGTTQNEVAKITSPDRQSVALVTLKEKHGVWLPGPEPPKTLARWVQLKVTHNAKTIYDSSDESLNVSQTGTTASDVMWSPDSTHVAYRYITTLRIIGLDGKLTTYRREPEDSVISSFRWIDNENLLVVSKKERYPLDMYGSPYYYNGYTDKAKDIRIARLNIANGFTEYHHQAVSDPTFLFHSVGFYLDEISPKADRVAFSDGSNLCVYDVTTRKLTVQVKIPQKPSPKPDPAAPGMEDQTIRAAREEMATWPAQLEGVWWPTNDKIVLGVGLLGGPTMSFYLYDLAEGKLTDKTDTLLAIWKASDKARNYQDADWYRSALK
ncbi:MAG: hypothetical protein ACTFAK_07540 [Candidatus Electronema sp. VV]